MIFSWCLTSKSKIQSCFQISLYNNGNRQTTFELWNLRAQPRSSSSSSLELYGGWRPCVLLYCPLQHITTNYIYCPNWYHTQHCPSILFLWGLSPGWNILLHCELMSLLTINLLTNYFPFPFFSNSLTVWLELGKKEILR